MYYMNCIKHIYMKLNISLEGSTRKRGVKNKTEEANEYDGYI